MLVIIILFSPFRFLHKREPALAWLRTFCIFCVGFAVWLSGMSFSVPFPALLLKTSSVREAPYKAAVANSEPNLKGAGLG